MSEHTPADPSNHDIRRRRSLVGQAAFKLLGKTGAVLGLAWILVTALLGFVAPLLANSYPLTWLVQDEAGQWHRQWPAFAYLTPLDVILTAGLLLMVGLACCYRAGGKLFWVWLMPMCMLLLPAFIFHLIQDHGRLMDVFTADQVGTASVVWWWFGRVLAALLALGGIAMCSAKLAKHPTWLITAIVLSVVLSGILFIPGLRVEPRPNFAYDTVRKMITDGQAKDAVFTLVPYSPDDLQVDAPVNPNLLPPGPSPSQADVAADMMSYMESQYDIRLYSLDQAKGDDTVTPAPITIDQALAAEKRLWSAYQKQNADDPAYDKAQGDKLRTKVLKGLEVFSGSEVGLRYHLMGTTGSGQDLTSRMIHGSRIALIIGFISTGIAVIIGIIIGGLLGYFVGWVDLIGLRLVEVFASIPVIMLLIMIVAFYGRSLILMMVVLGLTGWVGYAYFIRAEFLKLRKMDYVMAARASGTPLYLILFKHMLPNGVAPILVAASFGIAGAIMTEATLSFLGLGLENEPSWGQMLNEARQGGSFSWWLAIFPGAAIFLTVFAYNLIGEALRDVIDPRAVD